MQQATTHTPGQTNPFQAQLNLHNLHNQSSLHQSNNIFNNNNNIMQSNNLPNSSAFNANELFNPKENFIIECVYNMRNANNSKLMQSHLQNLYDTQGQQFIDTILNIIHKSTNRPTNTPTLPQLTQTHLLYLRHMLHTQPSRLPPLTKKLTTLHQSLLYSPHHRLSLQVLRTFLGKPNHKLYLKEYLHEVAYQVLQQIQTGAVSEEYLVMFAEVLEGLGEMGGRGAGIAVEAEGMVRVIVNGCGKRPGGVKAEVWAWAVLVLASYTKMTPSLQFVKQYISYNTLPLKVYLGLFQTLNKVHTKFYNIQQIYTILQTQLKRSQSHEFTTQLYLQHNIQSLQSLSRTVVYLLKTSFSLIQQQPPYDINQSYLYQYFHEYKLFHRGLSSLLGMLHQYPEQSEISWLITQLIEEYGQFLGEERLGGYFRQFVGEIGEGDVFCLLAGVGRGVMEMVGATGLCKRYIGEILEQEERNGGIDLEDDEIMSVMDMFLRFVIRYLDVYHYLEDQQIKIAIFKLCHQYISKLPSKIPTQPPTTTPHKKTLQQRTLKLLSYSISIQCRMQKYQPLPVPTPTTTQLTTTPAKTRISELLQLVYNIVYTLSTEVEADDQAEICGIALEGIAELGYVRGYGDVLMEALIGFFLGRVREEGSQGSQGNGGKFRSSLEFVYLNFLKILQDCHISMLSSQTPRYHNIMITQRIRNQRQYQFPTPNPIPPQYRLQKSPQLTTLFSLLTHLLQSHPNKSLSDQVTEYLLKLLFSTNCLYSKSKLNQSDLNFILEQIYSTGVFAYIERSFKEEDQDYLYCKLLMEVLVHAEGGKLVEGLLGRVCLVGDGGGGGVVHCFDVVWEALVIMYDVRNSYTEKRGINDKIDKIMGGNIQALFTGLSIDQKQQYTRKNKKQTTTATKRKKINWCWLPEVRKALQPGSYAGYCIDTKINQNSITD